MKSKKTLLYLIIIVCLFVFISFFYYVIKASSFDKETYDLNYKEMQIEYVIVEEKIVQEYREAIPSFTEKVVRGKTTGWSRASRYEVGKDVNPGKYSINVSGWANFNSYIGYVEVNSPNIGLIYMDPTAQAVCYHDEGSCSFGPYKKVHGVTFEDREIIYVEFPSYSGQSASLRFEAEIEEIKHEEVPVQEEIIAPSVKVVEKIRLFDDGKEECYINGYIVNKCEILNEYMKIKGMFNE